MSFLRKMSFLWLSLILFFLASIVYVEAGDELSDTDKMEIAAILFEHAGIVSETRQEQLLFLDPAADINLFPNLTGIEFKKLNYEELPQAEEYFDLRIIQERGKVTGVLLRGNLCRREGQRFGFKHSTRGWREEPIGFVRSGAIGKSCPACKISVPPTGSNQSEKRVNKIEPFHLLGNVEGIECRHDGAMVNCTADVMLSFVNSSKRPVILLQPSGDIEYDLGGIALSLEKESANSGLYVYNTSAFRSVSTGPEYRQLATRLDTQSPQPEVTRIIPAGETWELKVSARFSFNDENVCSLSVSNGIEIGWRAIRQLPSPLWLRLTLEVWPFNVENFKKDLGSKLRKRWKKYGEFIGQREDRYWHAIIVSEPIQLDLRGHI